jgi:hypothetical protein
MVVPLGRVRVTNAATIPYARHALAPVDRPRVVKLGLLSCAVGLFANAVPAYFILCMLRIPAGTAVRPTVETGMIFLGTLAGFAAGLPLALICLLTGRRWWAGWLLGFCAIMLSCLPWFVSSALWDWVFAKHGLIMKP